MHCLAESSNGGSPGKKAAESLGGISRNAHFTPPRTSVFDKSFATARRPAGRLSKPSSRDRDREIQRRHALDDLGSQDSGIVIVFGDDSIEIRLVVARGTK